MKGDHDVLKPHEGRPRCFEPMTREPKMQKWTDPDFEENATFHLKK